jgi:RNA polymerase sigma-70 factor (ECF subfamily)
MAWGPERGLRLLDELEDRGQLQGYYLLSAARADCHRRLKQWPEAAKAYRQAISQAANQAERRFLTNRLSEVDSCLKNSGPAIRPR